MATSSTEERLDVVCVKTSLKFHGAVSTIDQFTMILELYDALDPILNDVVLAPQAICMLLDTMLAKGKLQVDDHPMTHHLKYVSFEENGIYLLECDIVRELKIKFSQGTIHHNPWTGPHGEVRVDGFLEFKKVMPKGIALLEDQDRATWVKWFKTTGMNSRFEDLATTLHDENEGLRYVKKKASGLFSTIRDAFKKVHKDKGLGKEARHGEDPKQSMKIEDEESKK